MSGKLPDSFWFREKGRNKTTYIAKRSSKSEDRYVISRPAQDEPLGLMTLVPVGSRRRDGAGYRQNIMMGSDHLQGEAYWKPMRQINDANVEAVSVSRAVDSQGAQVDKIMFRLNSRQSYEVILPPSVSRQLYAQLYQRYGPKYE